MGSPSISVLMPVYNCERYVAEAAESILEQTFCDFEFIIVDDGSTDGSLAVLSRYAAQDSRVRLVSRPNTGIVGALNEGLSLARGEFVARMDADDVSLPVRFERQLAYLGENPSCIAVGSGMLYMDPDGAPLREWQNDVTHEDIMAAALRGIWPGVPHAPAMFRRESLLAAGGYRREYETAEDLDLFLRLADIGKLANLPDVLYKYRQHLRSICHARQAQQQGARRRILEAARRRRGLEMADSGCDPETSDGLSVAAQHRQWAWSALGSGYVRTARKHALKAVLRSPLSTSCWRALACAVRGH